MTPTARTLHWLFRLILAGVFVYSGYIKVQEPLQFAVAITGYRLFPDNLVCQLAKYLPWSEILLGAAILIGWRVRVFAAAAAALLLLFTAVLSITVLRGIDANCGCFGPDEPISAWTILRDASLLIPALYLAFESRLMRRRTIAGTE